jgi:hypothetical protein
MGWVGSVEGETDPMRSERVALFPRPRESAGPSGELKCNIAAFFSWKYSGRNRGNPKKRLSAPQGGEAGACESPVKSTAVRFRVWRPYFCQGPCEGRDPFFCRLCAGTMGPCLRRDLKICSNTSIEWFDLRITTEFAKQPWIKSGTALRLRERTMKLPERGIFRLLSRGRRDRAIAPEGSCSMRRASPAAAPGRRRARRS